MQEVLKKELIMDESHSFFLPDLPIAAGEKFTVIIMREDQEKPKKRLRKAYAHRFKADSLDLPAREELHER